MSEAVLGTSTVITPSTTATPVMESPKAPEAPVVAAPVAPVAPEASAPVVAPPVSPLAPVAPAIPPVAPEAQTPVVPAAPPVTTKSVMDTFRAIRAAVGGDTNFAMSQLEAGVEDPNQAKANWGAHQADLAGRGIPAGFTPGSAAQIQAAAKQSYFDAWNKK